MFRKSNLIVIPIICACYFIIILIINGLNANKLEEKGEYALCELVEIKHGAYFNQYIKYRFLTKEGEKFGYYSGIRSDYYKKGQIYLTVYLENDPKINYLFIENELSDTLDIYMNSQKFIPVNPNVKFWKL